MRRFLVIAGRVLLWAAVALVLVRGVVSIASSAHRAGQQVVAASPVAAFPSDAATAFGARFAHDYLSYDAGNPDLHRRQMTSYLAAGADPMAGWDGKGSQSASAVVPVRVDVLGPDLAVVTVAGQVTGGRWQYLDVTVSSNGGELVVPEPPSLVAGPATAGDAPDLAPSHVDASLSSSLRAPVEAFFRAYASGSTADLAYFAPSGRAPLTGLNGMVVLDAVLDLRVGEGGVDREAVAQVRWRDPVTDGTVTQLYHLGLVEREGRWYVDRLGLPPAPATKEAS